MTQNFTGQSQARHIVAAALLLSWATLLTGCGRGKGPEPALVPVSGRVEMDGKPLAGATMFFNPLQGTRGTGAYAVTDSAGMYKLTHRSTKLGCEAGNYGVTFSKVTQPDGSPIPSGTRRSDIPTVETLPPKYTQFDPKGFIEPAEVKGPAESVINFNLKSK